ncbi:hypothetical protein [Nocardia xishanensis]
MCDGAGVFDDTTSEQTADAAAGGGGCWGGAATTAQAPLTAPTAPQQLPFIAPAR